MMLVKRFRYIPAIVLMVLAFISCDDDFNSIGGELIGGQIDDLPRYEAGVVSYNKKLPPVQTNNLPVHLLGVYNEPVYGQQVANVLTQISLSTINPNFGEEPTLDSVVLTLPYYSTQLEADDEGNAVYRLDSVYGNAPFRLSIEQSNYFLNDFDPDENFENRQRYYSDQGELFENNIIGDPIYVNESFKPSAREVVVRELNPESGEIDTVSLSPRMRLHLPVEFFEENIINKQGSTELSNNNNFRNFIRGLYIKAEPVNGDGSMMLLDFRPDADAGIILYYTNPGEDADDEDVQRSYELTFGTNTVNTFTQEFPAQIEEEIQASGDAPGAENLYLKGGEGSMAVIELFEDEAEIDQIRENNWLINEANLTFYVNQDIVPGGEEEPSRIFLFNLETNELLLDYRIDPTGEATNPNLAVITHAPPLQRDEDGNGTFYKFRITEHIRRILDGDQPNEKLGLVVTQNISVISNSALRSPLVIGEDEIVRVPSSTVITPRGTVLHGNLSPDAAKRLKFNIFYTETSN